LTEFNKIHVDDDDEAKQSWKKKASIMPYAYQMCYHIIMKVKNGVIKIINWTSVACAGKYFFSHRVLCFGLGLGLWSLHTL